MVRRPPRSTRVPYTTLCRSAGFLEPLDEPARLLRAVRQDRDGLGGIMRGVTAGLACLADSCGHGVRSEEHTPELQSRQYLVCRLLLDNKTKPRLLRGTVAPH